MLTLEALGSQKAGLDPDLGLDKHFYDRAKDRGKQVIGLETAESQIDRLDEMPSDPGADAAQRAGGTTRNKPAIDTTAWQSGDAAAIRRRCLSFTSIPPPTVRSSSSRTGTGCRSSTPA